MAYQVKLLNTPNIIKPLQCMTVELLSSWLEKAIEELYEGYNVVIRRL